MENVEVSAHEPWNKGKLVGQNTPLKLKEIWAIRIRLQIACRCRELALFNLAIDSKLRACDLMQLRVRDVCHGQSMASRALILQQKTGRPVQFEITEPARMALTAWIAHSKLKSEDFLFPSRIHDSPHLSTRQYARIVDSWVTQLGLDPANYGTHTPPADESDIDISTNQELACSTASFGAYEAREHGTIPRYRSGRCP
jgi:integrase